MAKKTKRLWLMRGIGEKKSLMFSVAVRVEPEDGLYAAWVINMEEQMAAMGETEEEAVANAQMLFMATVDDALRRGVSIQYVTGQEAIALDLPIWMAPKFFHMLEQKLMEDDTDIQWVSIAATTQHEMAHVE
ncbi:MAG TPA: hypothetical protein VGD94_19060 [Vicinamibacterales bacterium]